MKFAAFAIFFALSPFTLPALLAQQQTFTVNPQASQVDFTLGDVLHTVHGTFHVESGAIEFGSTAPTVSGTIVVATGSGNTGSSDRDHKMNKEVLDVSRFPVASFTPQSYQGEIAPSGDSTIYVSGTFTLHGSPHPLAVPMQVHIEGNNCTAKTHFAVPYVKWGLKDPSNFLLHVAKEVDIDLTLIGHLSTPK